ncbi:PAS domain-containing protein [Hymenobacter sp. BT186]|uniref:histidine kinase n=1 Tax=Hymenobacter telluris TaxID=2816474 RepID=A0A939EV51_9BACT|nr:PAS domain-containing protein [Hymenobacter telluris]MBO0357797.1 PAS domain-containing protein [Hymenobacter telluris]MBW3373824.1 PAS domain-containing sensor histidine kinase [Hymenobacter norwichensis]
MSDSSVPLLPESSAAANLLETLLRVSLNGIILFRPVYAPDDETDIIDLAYVRLNAAAQQMLQLPEHPTDTFLTLYPNAKAEGIFDFYRTAFLLGQLNRFDVNYQHDGLDNYFQLSADRSGDLLVVSFSDTADHQRTAVEQALRESQAREQQARADAELQRQQLHNIFMQAPAMICIFEGPEHIFRLVNPPYQQLVGERPLVGMPIAEAMPELVGQPIFGLLDEVYRTGETFRAQEMLVQLDHSNSGSLGENYYNFIYQATRNLEGEIDGILVFAYEVTAQVKARRNVEHNEAQLQRLNQQLEAANEALMAAAQVAEAAQVEAETQRQRLYTVLEQLPASVSTYHGPNHIYQLVNPYYQQLFPGRSFQGRPIREVLPELEGQNYFEVFDEVYRTGEPYYSYESEAWVDRLNTGKLEQRYYNIFLQGLRDSQNNVDGILNFAYDVTEQVRARRQVQVLNEELAAANEELQAANEEIRASITELQISEQALMELNNTLENRVLVRTRQVQAAQQETERQRARLELFFRQAPAAICILDGPELVYELVNPRYQQLFPGRELLGKPILEALPELTGLPVWQTLRQVYETGVTHEEKDMLVPVARYAGDELEPFYFNYIQQARYNEHGHIDGVLVFAFETTAQVHIRKRAEALQAEVLAAAQHQAQQRESFYQVFEQTPACIVLLRGPQHRVEYYNKAYQQLFPGREMLGRTIAEIQPDAAAQGFVALLNKVYDTGETFFGDEMPLAIEQPNGRPPKKTYFNFTYQPYRENSQIVGISVFAYDVTGQVLARRQREAMQQQLQAVFEQAPAAIFVLRGPAYILEVVNPSMSAMLGRPISDLLGKPFFEAVPELKDQGYEELLDEVWHTGMPQVMRERAGQLEHHAPNEMGYYNFVYQPLRDEQETITGIICVAIDVTEQVRARQQVEQSSWEVQELNEELAAINEEMQATNEELSDTNQQLSRTNVDLDNFIYTASHDLRAPIANIEGLLQALTHQLPPSVANEDQVQPILDMMQGAVERFQKTINHLTDVTKLQKEQIQPTQTVDLAAILEEVRLDLTPLLAATQATLRVDVGTCPTISFSQKNLRSVVYNLLSNALKYSHPNRPPQVVVRCHQAKGYAVLEVEDNGLGLDEGQQARLFGMFQRFHDHVEGTGIGLYMVKRMIENVGGRIQVQSQLGEGTTFIVFFPR